MTLIKSISGIRGTIGGPAGENLTPPDVVKFTTAYVRLIARRNPGKKLTIVVGRDARISGEMVSNLVEGTLLACGADVVNVGLCSDFSVFVFIILFGSIRKIMSYRFILFAFNLIDHQYSICRMYLEENSQVFRFLVSYLLSLRVSNAVFECRSCI